MFETNIEVVFIETPFNEKAIDFFILSPLEKLDNTLNVLDKYSKNRKDIQSALGLQITTETSYEIDMVLKKLVKDQYVDEIKIQIKLEGPEYINPLGGVWHIT